MPSRNAQCWQTPKRYQEGRVAFEDLRAALQVTHKECNETEQ